MEVVVQGGGSGAFYWVGFFWDVVLFGFRVGFLCWVWFCGSVSVFVTGVSVDDIACFIQ